MKSDDVSMGLVHRFFRWFATFGMESPTASDLINDGNAHYSNQDYDRAIADYTEAIRIDAGNASAHSNRGMAFHCKQDYDRAIADYTEAIRLDPRLVQAYQGRGGVRLARLQFDLAIADYNAALQLDPRDVNSYVNRGNAWHNLHDCDRAFADYNEAIKLDPNSAPAYCGRGLCWLARQERDRTVDGAYQLDATGIRTDNRLGYDRALDDLCEAIRLNPADPWAFLGRGVTWQCLEEFDRAIADYSAAIRLEPNFVHAYMNRGHANREKHAYRSAIADFEKALEIAPDDVWSLNGLAWLLGSALDDSVRDGKRAVELARKAFALDWTFPAAWLDTLAVAHAEMGDFDEAVRTQEQALLTAPPAFAQDMRKRLDLYRKNMPYRQFSKRPLMTQFMTAKMH